jgi:hypothetical protein
MGEKPISESIVRAAVRDCDGEVFHLAPPARHHTIIHKFRVRPGREDQGFLTSQGRYVDRLEAMAIAKSAGQLKRPETGGYQGPELFSEDLW